MTRPTGTSIRTRQRHAAQRRAATGRRPARLTRDQVLTTYLALLGEGLVHKQIARRLGLTSGGLTYHLTAARKAGDPRAFVRYRPRTRPTTTVNNVNTLAEVA